MYIKDYDLDIDIDKEYLVLINNISKLRFLDIIDNITYLKLHKSIDCWLKHYKGVN